MLNVIRIQYGSLLFLIIGVKKVAVNEASDSKRNDEKEDLFVAQFIKGASREIINQYFAQLLNIFKSC